MGVMNGIKEFVHAKSFIITPCRIYWTWEDYQNVTLLVIKLRLLLELGFSRMHTVWMLKILSDLAYSMKVLIRTKVWKYAYSMSSIFGFPGNLKKIIYNLAKFHSIIWFPARACKDREILADFCKFHCSMTPSKKYALIRYELVSNNQFSKPPHRLSMIDRMQEVVTRRDALYWRFMQITPTTSIYNQPVTARTEETYCDIDITSLGLI